MMARRRFLTTLGLGGAAVLLMPSHLGTPSSRERLELFLLRRGVHSIDMTDQTFRMLTRKELHGPFFESIARNGWNAEKLALAERLFLQHGRFHLGEMDLPVEVRFAVLENGEPPYALEAYYSEEGVLFTLFLNAPAPGVPVVEKLIEFEIRRLKYFEVAEKFRGVPFATRSTGGQFQYAFGEFHEYIAEDFAQNIGDANMKHFARAAKGKIDFILPMWMAKTWGSGNPAEDHSAWRHEAERIWTQFLGSARPTLADIRRSISRYMREIPPNLLHGLALQEAVARELGDRRFPDVSAALDENSRKDILVLYRFLVEVFRAQFQLERRRKTQPEKLPHPPGPDPIFGPGDRVPT